MARNSEKAMTTLARWRAAHLENTKEKERRPYLASECDDLSKAEKFRRQIIGEISRRVAQIQNAGLGEFKLRDLNDEINKLLREKRHWENRIIELGGPNYRRYGPKMLDKEGREVPGNRGYKYFGAAKDLPGVRELFDPEPPKTNKKSRAELMKDIDADYYGYRDEDDGVLVPLEKQEEKRVISEKVKEWKLQHESNLKKSENNSMEILAPLDFNVTEKPMLESPASLTVHDDVEMDFYLNKDEDDFEPKRFVAHVPVPSQQEVEEALVRRKKMQLLKRYASDSLMKETSDVMNMLGYTSSQVEVTDKQEEKM